MHKLAWFEYLLVAAERSVQLLSQAAERQKAQARSVELSLSREVHLESARSLFQEASRVSTNRWRSAKIGASPAYMKANPSGSWAAKKRPLQSGPVRLSAIRVLRSPAIFWRVRSERWANWRTPRPDEKQADEATPNDALYREMVALRLERVGAVRELAAKHFLRATELSSLRTGKKLVHLVGDLVRDLQSLTLKKWQVGRDRDVNPRAKNIDANKKAIPL